MKRMKQKESIINELETMNETSTNKNSQFAFGKKKTRNFIEMTA